MVREINLIGYLPEFIQEYQEIKKIMETENPEFQALITASLIFMDNQFILTTDEAGILRFEQMLSIQYLDTDTLADRQFRVKSRWNNYVPYTKNTLEEKLTMLCGEDGYSVNYATGTIIVRVALTSKKSYSEVKKMLEELIPCDMIIDLSLLYNQYSLLSKYTHRQLKQWTHDIIRNEVLTNG